MVAGIPLRLPPDVSLHALSDPDSRELVERFVAASPERTLYHEPGYIDFARAINGRADLIVLTRDGNPLLGLPFHPQGVSTVSMGYAGALFPPVTSESALRRSFDQLRELIDANRTLIFRCLQCAQAPGYADPARVTLLEWGFDSQGLRGESLYSRVLELEPGGDNELRPGAELGGDAFAADLSAGYDPDLRNQLRQAARNRLVVELHAPRDEEARRALHERLHRIHVSSWQRTGLPPHDLEYMIALSRAVHDAGGSELSAVIRSPDGDSLAYASCHAREGRALYWSGGSVDEGLPLRANSLALHAAISACAALGTTAFELGRFSSRERSEKEIGVTRYKAQFGGRLVPIANFATDAAITGKAVWAARRLSARRQRTVPS